jgi:hypothetical protein
VRPSPWTGTRFARLTGAMHKVCRYLSWVIGTALLVVAGLSIGIIIKMYTGPQWGLFVPPDGCFQALFPDTPIHEAAPAPFPFPGEQTFFSAETEVATYRVSYVFAPPGLSGAMESFATDAAASLGGRLEVAAIPTSSDTDHQKHQYSTRPFDFRILLDDGRVVYGRVVATKKRLFRLLVSRPQIESDPADVSFFFDNFSPRGGSMVQF